MKDWTHQMYKVSRKTRTGRQDVRRIRTGIETG